MDNYQHFRQYRNKDKSQLYADLAEWTAKELTTKRNHWMNFLDTAARLYKYPFPDQLMIYAQRPDVIACAPIETWNDSFNRWVRRGSKGIALIDDTGNYPRLKYVFDVADTEPSLYNSRPVYLWEMRQEHKITVLAELSKVYDDISVDDSLADSFRSIAKQLTAEYYIDNAREIRFSAENSFLEELDDDNLGIIFEGALSTSVAYTLMSRCGFDTAEYFEEDDFQEIFDFNTPDLIYALGTATGELSEQVLRDIETIIKKYERLHTAERSEQDYDRNPYLQESGRLSAPEHNAERTAERGDGAVGQVRPNAESISERPSDDSLQSPVADGAVISALAGNGGSGEREIGAGDESADGEESVTRQDERPDGLDGVDERAESASGRNGSERTDLRLNDNSATYSQVGNNLIESLSASSITPDEADTILRSGGNDYASHLRIAAYFSKGKTPDENAAFLRREYLRGKYDHEERPGGKGFQFGSQPTSIWFDETGITIERGKTALSARDSAHITWEQAAARIKELFDTGRYVTHEIFSEAVDNEKSELAGGLWDFYRDNMEFLPDEWRSEHGYPADVEIIKSLLDDPNERQAILNRLESDVASWHSKADRHSWHDPDHLLVDMRNSMIPPNDFPAADFQSVSYMPFITDDEVDAYLTQGSHFSEGKFRILSYFMNDHTEKERMDFLKNEYGHGGGTWSGVDGGYTEATPGSGITLKRSGCANVNLNWSRAAQRISDLIQNGRYMTQSELDRIPEYEHLILARQIKNFYADLPDEYQCPFAKELDFYYPHEAEWNAINNFLDDSEHIETVLGEMQYIYTNTPEEDRYYNLRREGFTNLAAYYEGTYTLFPGLDNTPEIAHTPVVLPLVSPQLADGEQISLFADELFPALPSVVEQREKIDQKLQQEAENADKSFMNISDADKIRITNQFADNPRSREMANLVREIYGDSLNMPLPQAVKRISELFADGKFELSEYRKLPILQECERIKQENGDAVVMYQVGDFFEMYGADAELAADVLGIVAFESRDGLPEPVKTAGIPKHMFGEYTIKLHEAGHRLAVSTLTADGSRNVFIYEATPPIEPVQYNIGDRLMYNGKLHEITKIDNYVQLQNRDMTNPARYPIFDNVALLRDDFERMLSDGELAIMPPDVIPEPEKPLDFDSISQMVLDRVMADTNYAETLANATSRASLRNPCTWALDQSIRDHEQDEPQIYRAYFWDDDFNDRLFDFVLRQSWEQRKQHVAEVNSQTEAAKPTAEKLLSQYGTDYYLFHFPENNEVPAELSIDTLSLITEKAEHYVICADALNLSEDDLTKYNIEFRKMPRDFELLPETVREKINEINPGYMEDLICSELVLRGYDIYGDLIKDGLMDYRTHGGRGNVQDIADFIENEYLAEETEQTPELDEIESTVVPSTERDISEPSTIVPSPVFFVDWDSAQYDFDLNLYNDRDIIGYNKDGVEYRAGRSGSLNYITNTGAFWGSNTVPGNIYEQINTYKNGELTNEQVRENYLNVLETFRNYRIADLERTNTDLIDVLNNGLISQAEKDTVSSMFKNSAVNHDITVLLSESYNGTVETMMLTGGEIADYSATSESLTIEIIDKFDTKLSFTWVDIAPVVRVLAQQWEAKPIELEPPESVELPTQMSITQTKPERKTNATPTNYRITDDRLGEGGAKTKFRNNINAIITLHDIEFEKRAATSEEQEILSKYVGWGGLPQAFDPDNAQWTNEYLELNSALSPNEWESARASTLNAHYTSPTVIRAIYDTVERLGFKSGNILEPSCGVGNFFGLLPDDMKSSKLYGIELDSVTGKIAQLLYPNADIKITGYEKSDMPDNFMDLAIGNIPFGGYGVADKRYDKYNLYIHDYFFAKTLDKVRPGGIIAFITSKGTLDKQNPEVRKYIAQRAELLGAVRLPNNAFLRNAGTEVTSDIIFLQKRDRPIDIEPDWVHLGLTDDGVPINRYFIDNPEMLLGTMAFDDRMYGKEKDTTCNPIEGADLAEQLKTALSYIRGQYTIEELDDLDGVDDHAIPADSNVKNFSYADVDGMVYFRENSLMYPVDLPAATLERIRGMIGLRKCVHRLIDLQLDEHSEPEIRIQQTELNDLYDSFITQFGLINSQANNRAFNADSAYYLLCSLEIIDEDGNLERKADMFTKRTIKQKTVITHVDTASEALAVSLGEKACVDMAYMSELTGFTPEKLYQDLEGIIFYNFGNPDRSLPPFNPETMKLHEKFLLVTSDEYLSGNVRDKLYVIKKFNEGVGDIWQGVDITVNVKALEAAQPKDLTASEIAVRLGSTWIDPEYIQQFMYELLNTSYYNKKVYQVKYHSYTGEWQVTGKGKAQYSDIHATVTYGTSRMNAYQIIDDTLNLRDARVYDYNKDADGNDKRVLNKKETTLAQQKQEQIKQAFRDWIWKDPERRQALVRKYNDMFNSIKPREYDGSHIVFSGISPEITLRPHQLNAIAHILYGGNTLLAHEVGAGKTFEMVGAAMESKRLGLCQKSLFAVPNHLTEQWAGEFLRLYPSANILVATKKDFEMRNRKKFCAKIATGDYDAVIIGHSQMEKIPMSQERQERLLNEQIWEIEEGIRELKASNGERFSIKQLEKTKKSLEVRLAKLLESKKRDDVVTFEQLGVDRLFIDEAHAFKDL